MSNEELTVLVLAGTSRQGRESIKVARYMAQFGQNLAHTKTTLAEPRDFVFPHDGNGPDARDARYTKLTAEAEAFLIVTPEYNHSFPGSLKRMLDSEYANYAHKPVAFVGVSNGAWGGARAVEALVPAVREMGLVATSWSVYFPRVQNIFDDSGVLSAEYTATYTKQATLLYDELLWMARALKHGREHL